MTWSLKSLPKVSNLNIPVDGGKYQAKVRLYLPPDFSESKRYPLVINVYGGPNSQQVNDRFKLDWGTYLTTSENVIYGLIDGRGSGFKVSFCQSSEFGEICRWIEYGCHSPRVIL